VTGSPRLGANVGGAYLCDHGDGCEPTAGGRAHGNGLSFHDHVCDGRLPRAGGCVSPRYAGANPLSSLLLLKWGDLVESVILALP